MTEDDLKALRGLVATVCTSSLVKPQYATALSNLRSYNDRNGWHGVEYKIFPATLVESARDEIVAHAITHKYDWILQIDADAAPFAADSLPRMLQNIYVNCPMFDAIGAYCQIKGLVNFPTIDTGTGKWEEHYPGEGILPVMRTGAHFLMTKMSAFARFGPPWFRTRIPLHPARAFLEADTFARTKLDGNNPFWGKEWECLLQEALTIPGDIMKPIGEDSGFFDNLKAHGGRAAVDTDLVVGHVDDFIIGPDKYIKYIKNRRVSFRKLLGVYE